MFATLIVASALAPSFADMREDERERAVALVEQLADPSFRVRENASDELVKLGAAAVDALRKGLVHKDTEVSERCRKLLPQALDFHMQEQIDKFLAKPDGPIPEDLPGLKRWIDITGASKDSREMYAAMVKEHRRVLIDVETEPNQATQKYQAFAMDVYNRFRVGGLNGRRDLITQQETLLFFFLGSDVNCRKGTTSTGTIPYVQALQFLNGSHITGMLSGKDDSSEAFQKLFLAWLEQERYLSLVRRGFQLAAGANLKEAAPMAIKVALDKTAAATTRSYALLSAVKLFGKDDIKKLEPLMDDKTIIGRIGVANADPITTEIRDIALGIVVQATGQNMAEYGFDRFRATSGITTSYSYYGMTEKKREAGFQKWKDWLAKNKK